MVVFCGLSEILTRKKHKDTFLLSYFSMTKSTKSHLRGLFPLSRRRQPTHCVHWFIPPPLKKLPPRARVSRASRAWQARATRDKSKVAVLPLSATSYYHACEHITRKSRADSCTHCLHARYKCRAGVTLICALTGLQKQTLSRYVRTQTRTQI